VTAAVEATMWPPPGYVFPKSRRATLLIFGDPTRGGQFSCEDEDHVDPAWRHANIVELHGSTAIPEIPAVLYFKTHRLVAPAMRAGFAAAHRACPEYVIDHDTGCWVPRHMRHNPDMPLSPHTMACAVDINEGKNAAKYIHHSEVPEPWSPAWLKLWPAGLPRSYVQAWKATGAKWGGDWNLADKHGMVFIDPMHVYYGV
jgi:hypothetical protein